MNRWSKPGEAYAYETGYIEGRADAVKHGKWIKKYRGNYLCSVCGAWYRTTDDYGNIIDGEMTANYCESCGAKMDEDNATPYAECKTNLYSETKLRFVLDECIEDEELIEKILKALDEVKK